MERCNVVCKFATVKWTLPSRLSGDGVTVAAFAAHIADALEQARSKNGEDADAAAMTCSSLPAKPRDLRVTRLGLSWGGRTA
jgi:hypothetical protein